MNAITPNDGQVTALVTGANRGLGRHFAAELCGAAPRCTRPHDGPKPSTCPA